MDTNTDKTIGRKIGIGNREGSLLLVNNGIEKIDNLSNSCDVANAHQKHFSRRSALNILAISCSALLLNGCTSLFSLLSPVKGNTTVYNSNSSAPTSAYGQKVVKTASSQLGVKYVLGGTSPSTGFDCSGLIYWAYKEHGIKVPRVTKDQAYAGIPAPMNKLEAGDILVFASSSAPNNLHTALYIGNQKFIHSPNSRSKVRENSLTESYWGTHLALARRIV